ncbi:MAG: hypothetical protein IKI77_08405 [Oscillospiraceae bacterium]|nr:hypothetical protein [Oscillospiraceae bacterium]
MVILLIIISKFQFFCAAASAERAVQACKRFIIVLGAVSFAPSLITTAAAAGWSQLFENFFEIQRNIFPEMQISLLSAENHAILNAIYLPAEKFFCMV